MPTDDIEPKGQSPSPEPDPRLTDGSPCLPCSGPDRTPPPTQEAARVSRRPFLGRAVVAGALAVAARFLPPIGRLRTLPSVPLAQGQAAGELYAGFLLLPEDAHVPATVKPPPAGTTPIMEHLPGGPQPTGTIKQLASAQDLAKALPFPLYTLRQVPPGLRRGAAWLQQGGSGLTYMASVTYQSYNSEHGVWLDNVSISALPNFPSPYPFWSTTRGLPANAVTAPQNISVLPAPGKDGPPKRIDPKQFPGLPTPAGPTPSLRTIAPEKVSYLPSPGILWPTGLGYLFLWIKDGVLYRLQVENKPTAQEAQAIAGLLTIVSTKQGQPPEAAS